MSEYETEVQVTDGKFTIRPAVGSENAKICYVNIAQLSSVITSLNHEMPSNKLMVYPNPAKGKVTIQLKQPIVGEAVIYMTNFLYIDVNQKNNYRY